jgi:hypothetical protein
MGIEEHIAPKIGTPVMPEVQKEEEEEEDLFVFNENKCGLVSYLV